jgi:hypothetical protein
MKMLRFAVIILSVAIASAVAVDLCSTEAAPKSDIKRLPPSSFPELPKGIITYLTVRKYTIPQSPETGSRRRHNVISGSFKKGDQKDWAVVASKEGSSKIIIFWGGSTSHPTSMQESKDSEWLQQMPEGLSYSRVINTVGKRYIIQHYKWYGGKRPPPIDHEGINHAFAGKASVVLYYYKGKWLELTGILLPSKL